MTWSSGICFTTRHDKKEGSVAPQRNYCKEHHQLDNNNKSKPNLVSQGDTGNQKYSSWTLWKREALSKGEMTEDESREIERTGHEWLAMFCIVFFFDCFFLWENVFPVTFLKTFLKTSCVFLGKKNLLWRRLCFFMTPCHDCVSLSSFPNRVSLHMIRRQSTALQSLLEGQIRHWFSSCISDSFSWVLFLRTFLEVLLWESLETSFRGNILQLLIIRVKVSSWPSWVPRIVWS